MNLHAMHPALRARGDWSWNVEYRNLCAAKAWGCPTPAAFRAMDKSDQIDVIAWYEADWRIKAVSAYEAARKRKK